MQVRLEPTWRRRAERIATVDVNAIDRFAVSLEVVIRRCRRSDLGPLEWSGLFTRGRELMESTYAAQARGESIMLVAEMNKVAVGQAWIDLTRRPLDGTGCLWALRVLPALQNAGIGTRLIAAAEELLCDRGFKRVELSVERTNLAAVRLYGRLGYRRVKTVPHNDESVTLDPVPVCLPVSQYLFRKPLVS